MTDTTAWKKLAGYLDAFGESGIAMGVDPVPVSALQERIADVCKTEPLPIIAVAVTAVLVNAIRLMVEQVEGTMIQ